jgi:hypothetical protein
LSHPFGVVPAAQVGLWLLIAPGRSAACRAGDAALFAASALAAFALWLPLIALHPDLFRAQFFGNVFRPEGPTAPRTLLDVLSGLAVQPRRFWDYAGPPQAILVLLGLAWAALRAPGTAGGRALCYHVAAGFVLLFLFQGDHPTLGYFAYPTALACVAVGGLVSRVAGRFDRRPGLGTALATAALVAIFLPGAGLRTLVAHLRHLRDPAYDAHALARSIMADIPPDAVAAVGAEYVLDFYLAGRPAIDALIDPVPEVHLYDVRDRPYDYVVLGPVTHRLYKSRMPDLVPIRSYGDPRDPFAPRAELFRRPGSSP